MRDDFAAFVLSHGRADRVITVDALRRAGYTGRLYVVVDDEDPALDEYRTRYGDAVLTFSKPDVAETFDVGDLEPNRQTVAYARNACWDLARSVGVRYFAELDDDYKDFLYRVVGRTDGGLPRLRGWAIRNLDGVLEAMVRFVEETPTTTIAMSQGGDWMGGTEGAMAAIRLKRKAMNSFVCDVDRPFDFVGRLNEDVNTYLALGRTGRLFFTVSTVQLNQLATQSNEGGMTDAYLDAGTYVKSFFSVLYAPSCVQIRSMGRTDRRLHHRIDWDAAVPKIVSAKLRRRR